MIFDPLTRSQPDRGASGNLGLGLYITSEVMVAHGGTIEVPWFEAVARSACAWALSISWRL